MKVALVVFPLHYSHGCILQTYALYSKLEQLECEVTIYDRQPNKESFATYLKRAVKRVGKWVLKGYRGPIFFSGYYPKSIMREQLRFIDRFRDDIVSVYSTEELRLRIEAGNYEAIVVGSDQTWRPRNVPNVMDYWLEFAAGMNMKKVAYAPSFGVDVWEYSEAQTDKCRELAAKFDAISVREESGVTLCKDHLYVEAKHVLDPTLLWTKDFYASFAENCPLQEGTLNCYFLDKSEKKSAIGNKIAQQLGLSVVQVNTKTEDSNASVKERMAPSIEKWLSGFRYGEFIVVDSFHAMVFSIIFEKPFIVIGNPRRGMARFESLLGELGLRNRLVTEDVKDVDEIIKSEINWQEVRQRLDQKRKACSIFLVNGLGLDAVCA